MPPGDALELDEEELTTTRSRLTTLVGGALGVVVLVSIAVATFGHQHTGSAASLSGTSTNSAIPAPQPTLTTTIPPTIAGRSALVSVGSHSERDTMLQFEYETNVINESPDAIAVQYPIEVLGPLRSPVRVESAGIYDLGDEQGSAHPPAMPSRLGVLPRGQTARLIIALQLDCRQAAVQERWPADQPVIDIHVVGFMAPTTLALGSAGDYERAVRDACHR
ncbi:MAG: hypothetical protein M3O28_14155 [Actinomycetota bacterium]|nr:hypothetical protein [Actinomycetota bacterium]